MKTISGIVFSDDYDSFSITAKDIEILKIRFCFMWEGDAIHDIYHYSCDPLTFEKSETLLNEVLSIGGSHDTKENLAGIERATFLIDRFYMFAEYLQHPHDGDCTSKPFTCERCLLERLLNIDTTNTINNHKKTGASK